MSNIIKVPLFFAGFIMLGLTFGYLTFKLLSFSRTVEVPSLVNLTLVEANEALSKAGLYLKIEGEDFDATVMTGKILRQDIPAGNTVKEKRAIKVVISKGPRVHSVPLVVNETLSNAESIMIQKGLKIGKVISVHSDRVEKGKIVAQRPEPEEKLNDSITVLVSLGPNEATYFCPDLTDKDFESAAELLSKMGLLIEKKGTGEIIKSQKPKPGAVVKTGDTINVEMKEANTL